MDERINRRIGQLTKASEREVAKYYSRLLKEIRLSLSWYYEKYESGGVLTYEEMAKYDRLKRLERDLRQVVKQTYKDVDKAIIRALRDVYAEGYYLTAWGIENETGKHLSYTTISDEILASVNNPISGLTLSDRLEKNRQQIEWKIREVVTQGLVQGETYSTMMRNLKETVDGDRTKVMRIVRTEAHRVMEEGKQDSREYAQSMGIILHKEWLSSKDERLRDTHRSLDGVKIPVDEYFENASGRALYPGGFGIAREDINCRCTTIQTIEGIAEPKLKDKSKQSYDEFLKEVKR